MKLFIKIVCIIGLVLVGLVTPNTYPVVYPIQRIGSETIRYSGIQTLIFINDSDKPIEVCKLSDVSLINYKRGPALKANNKSIEFAKQVNPSTLCTLKQTMKPHEKITLENVSWSFDQGMDPIGILQCSVLILPNKPFEMRGAAVPWRLGLILAHDSIPVINIATMQLTVIPAAKPAPAVQPLPQQLQEFHDEKQQEKVSISDYEPKRDFPEIKKIYDTMDEQTIKVLGRGIPEAIEKYPKGSRSDKYQMLDGTEVYFDIKVLRTDKNLVGFIVSGVTQKADTHEITQCKIVPIVIAKEFRGKGYGTNLMKASVDYFTHEGCKIVLLEVHPENAGAIKLYTKMGFKEIAHEPDTITMEWPVQK